MGVCNCSMFRCTFLYVHSGIAIILMGKRELVALLNMSSWCLVIFEWLFLTVPWGCLRFVIVVFPDHSHLLFLVWYDLTYFTWRSIGSAFLLFMFNVFCYVISCRLIIICCDRISLLALIWIVFICFCHFPIWCSGSCEVLDCIYSLFCYPL